MKRNNRRKLGFSYIELLAVIAIIGILLAIAIPNVVSWRRNLHITEMDSAARTVFVAAQNRLSELRASGEINNLIGNKTDMEPSDFSNTELSWGDFKTGFFYLGSDDTADMDLLLPEGALEGQLSNGTYYIEYNKDTGMVYSVFYSDKNFSYATRSEDVDKIRQDKGYRSKHAPVIGYYGGTAADWAGIEFLGAPEFKVVNEEELYIELDTQSDSIEMGAALTFYVEDEEGNSWTYKTDDFMPANVSTNGSIYKVVLDSLKSSGSGASQHVSALGLTPASNLTIKVTQTKDGMLSKADKVTENSLFASVEEKEATILFNRHLQNLEPTVSGIDETDEALITSAVVGDKLDWADTKAVQLRDTAQFTSIYNKALESFDGQNNMIQNLDNALFEQFGDTAGETNAIKKVILYDSYITNAKVKANSYGLLANVTKYTKVSDCVVYTKYKEKTDAIKNNKTPTNRASITITANGAAKAKIGGLIGSATTTEIENSSASVQALSTNYAEASIGGLVGEVVAGECKITKSYASFGWWDAAKKVWSDVSGLIGGKQAVIGGLIGKNAGATAITDCYTVGNIQNKKIASPGNSYFAGMIGYSSTSGVNLKFERNYAAVSYANAGKEASINIGGLVGNSISFTNNATYFLQGMRTPFDGAGVTFSQLQQLFSNVPGTWKKVNASASYPYGQTGSYPFPKLAGLDPYGDWPEVSYYTIVFWLEKPGLPFFVDADEGKGTSTDEKNVKNYDQIITMVREGGLGEEMVDMSTDAPSSVNVQMLQVPSTMAENPKGYPYASKKWTTTSTEVVNNVSTTFINVYYTRNVYKLQFGISATDTAGGSGEKNAQTKVSSQMYKRIQDNVAAGKAELVLPAGFTADRKIPYGQKLTYSFDAKIGMNVEDVFPYIIYEDEISFDHVSDATGKTTSVIRGFGTNAFSNIVIFDENQTRVAKYAASYTPATKTFAYKPIWSPISNQILTVGYTYVESLYQDPHRTDITYDTEPRLDYTNPSLVRNKSEGFYIDFLYYFGGVKTDLQLPLRYFDLHETSGPYWASAQDRQIYSVREGFTPLAKVEGGNGYYPCYQWDKSGNGSTPWFYQLNATGNRNDQQRYYFYSRNTYRLSLYIDATHPDVTVDSAVKYEMPLIHYKDAISATAQANLPKGAVITGYYYDADHKNPIDIETMTMPALDLRLFVSYKVVDGMLYYYEKYDDGEYGLFGEYTQNALNRNTLNDTKEVVEDGYVLISAFPSIAGFSAPEKKGDEYWYYVKKPSDSMPKSPSKVHSGDIYKIELPNITYYFNPYFAKTVSDDASKVPVSSFIIRTANQLVNLGTKSAYYGKDFLQERNVDFATYTSKSITIKPIGTKTNPFTGTYDGNSKIVYTNSYGTSTSYQVGLFGVIDTGAAVQDVTMIGDRTGSNATVSGKDCLAPLAGVNMGTVKNCYAEGFNIAAYSNDAAGLIGTNNGTVEDCAVTNIEIDIFGAKEAKSNIGGVVGQNQGASAVVKNCAVSNVSVSATTNIGALVGINHSKIIDCTAKDSALDGDKQVGGLVGYSSGTISNCDVENITAFTVTDYAGGLSGHTSGPAIDCTVKDVDVTSQGGSAGGVFGYINSTATNCSVKNATVIADVEYAGGSAGTLGGTLNKCDVKDSYVLTKGNGAGGLAGYSSGKATDCTVKDITVATQVQGAGGLIGVNNSDSGGYTGLMVKDSEVIGGNNLGGLIGNNQKAINGGLTASGVSVSGKNYVGGAVGTSSFGMSNITVSGLSTATVEGISSVGGFIGQTTASAKVYTNCAVNGLKKVSATGDNAGGFIGSADGSSSTFENCTTSSIGSVKGLNNVGGFAGRSISWKVNYTNCDVTNIPTIEGKTNVGGHAGYLAQWNSVLTFCDVKGVTTIKATTSCAGGLFGLMQDGVKADRCTITGPTRVVCPQSTTRGIIAGRRDGNNTNIATCSGTNITLAAS